MPEAQNEIDAGERFAFGENWRQFLDFLNDDRIREAESSLRERLGDIAGCRLIDIGSGSGLFSLAARNLGAAVVSVDYDKTCVECTTELRHRYRQDDPDWGICQGSALDAAFLGGLGDFDIVYSWGVLHHTGDMWTAMANLPDLVAPAGRLFISIYNDQGFASRQWRRIKRSYNSGGRLKRQGVVIAVASYFWSRSAVSTISGWMRGNKGEIVRPARGMDRRRDLVDWVGGYPFEVARPEQVFNFYRERGFRLDQLKTCGGGLGCNEFVFTREF